MLLPNRLLPTSDFFCKMEPDILSQREGLNMTEEKMQGEARQAFLVNTLQKLLGQDSLTGKQKRRE